jgi:predicted acetyltransferase
MDHVTEVLCPSWGVAPREHEGVRRMMRGLSIDGQGPYRAYVLYRDGSPVSSLLIYSQAEVAGVQLVSTLPSCRGKGYAQRLLIHSLLEAKRHGAEASVLEATKMGVASYSRIGFRECGRSRYFVPPHQKASR